jgi:HK97 family phage major capsid protein
MELLEIQTRMGKIVSEQRALNDQNVGKDWAAEDTATDTALDSEYRRLEADVTRIKTAEQREAALAKVEYKKKEIQDTSGKSALDAEIRGLRAFLLNDHKVMDELRAAQSSVVNADGAYTVPTTLFNEIDKALVAFGGIRSVSKILTTSTGNPFDMPTVADTGNVGALTAQNADAGGATKVAFGTKQLNSYKISSGVLQIPNELIRDSQFDIVPFLVDLIVERVARKYSTYAITGTGSSQPQGVTIGASTGITAAVSALTADNILDLIHSVDPAYRTSKNFAVACNDATIKTIRKFKDSNGQYIWQMGNIQTGAPSSIWNVPIVTDQGFADIGVSTISMLAGDFSKYVIREVGSGELRQSTERYFELDQLGILYQRSVDMIVTNSAAIKKLTHAAS